MKRHLLLSSMVKPFFRENAGLLAFVYYIMFLAVGQANGVGIIDYHYSLIRGLLGDFSFLLAVHCVWVIYALRCVQFVRTTLQKPEFAFLKMLALVDERKLFTMLLATQVLLFLPVLLYVIIIVAVGYIDHFYLSTSIVLSSNVIISMLCALYYFNLVRNRQQQSFRSLQRVMKPRFYFNFLLRYVQEEGKVLYLLIKIFSCGTSFFLLRERDPLNETDLRLPIFFYCIAVLTHSILIHRVKDLENWRLTFYRTLPVPLINRFANYACFYFCLFVPEVLMCASLTPAHITFSELCFFLFFGFGLLLMLNSLQLYNYTGVKEYLKTIMQFFVVFALALIPGWHVAFSIIIFTLAIILFFTRYLRFEPYPNNVMR
jgi:hypothetical protein